MLDSTLKTDEIKENSNAPEINIASVGQTDESRVRKLYHFVLSNKN